MIHYGKICATCDRRYGNPQPRGWIDIERCPPCADKGMKVRDHLGYRTASDTSVMVAKREYWRDKKKAQKVRMTLNKDDLEAMIKVEEFGVYPQAYPIGRRMELEKAGVVEETTDCFRLTAIGVKLLLEAPIRRDKGPIIH